MSTCFMEVPIGYSMMYVAHFESSQLALKQVARRTGLAGRYYCPRPKRKMASGLKGISQCIGYFYEVLNIEDSNLIWVSVSFWKSCGVWDVLISTTRLKFYRNNQSL
jgi:hypothetical protein